MLAALISALATLAVCLIGVGWKLYELRREFEERREDRGAEKLLQDERLAFEITTRDIEVWRSEAHDLRERVDALQERLDQQAIDLDGALRGRARADEERRHCEEVLRATEINVSRLAEGLRKLGVSLPKLIEIDSPHRPHGAR